MGPWKGIWNLGTIQLQPLAGKQLLDFEFRSGEPPKSRIRVGFGFRVSGFGFRVSGFGFRVSIGPGEGKSRFRVSGFGFRVLGFGFRVSIGPGEGKSSESVSGFGFRVSGFGFRVSGFDRSCR